MTGSMPIGRLGHGAMVDFHMRQKMLLLAHSPAAMRALGRIVARHGENGAPAGDDAAVRYRELFEQTCATPITRGGHANALQHMAGHLRGRIDDDERRALAAMIEAFRIGDVELRAVIEVIRGHATRLGVRYLLDQEYLVSR